MSEIVNVTALQKAINAWHGAAPDWVIALAEEASRTSMAYAARRIGYSTSVVSAVIANKYKGDLGAVEGHIRGALLGDEVDCPVLGDIRKDKCMEEQAKPHFGTSAIRTRLYHACRNGCVHSRIKGPDHAPR